jgi:hypothetical protein
MPWDVTQVPDDPDNGHISANDAIGEVIAGVSESLAVDLTSANVTLTEAQYTFNVVFVCSGHSVARTLTLFQIEKEAVIVNSGTGVLTVKRGTTEIALQAGRVRRFYTDGTANGLIATSASTVEGGTADSGTVYDFGCSFEDTPADGATIGRVQIGRDITIPANASGSSGKVEANPDATYIISVQDDGAEIATISVSTGGTPTFATTGGTAKSVAAGSAIKFVAPSSSPPEGSIAGGSFVILARVT